jgi:hypothetical protein
LEFLTAGLHCLPDFVAGDAIAKRYPSSDNGPPRETRLSWTAGHRRHAVLSELAESPPADVAAPEPAAPEAIQHINRKGDTYYLHQGHTKTGKPRYYFSKKTEGELCRELPDGFEIYENPRGQVFCRRVQPKLIRDEEIEVVREALHNCGKHLWAGVDVKKKDIIVYEREDPCLKFSLCDDDRRLFVASRWCYLGSTDDWLPLFGGAQPLSQLASQYCRHIGEESFFELM